MFPPTQGNSCLEAGSRFVISIYGTENVFTADNGQLRVRTYDGRLNQVWECMQDKDNQFGFTNKHTRRILGTNNKTGLVCDAVRLEEWEYLTFTRLSTGGHRLFVSIGGKLRTILPVTDSRGMYMKVGESSTAVGLHRLEEPVFRRFQWVIPGRLARASAPHYHSQDEDQNMDKEAIDFLLEHGIGNIISLNSHPLSREEIVRLESHGIAYTNVALESFGTPTLAQLETVNSYFTAGGTTLVYSGYGYGRTGTAISALQLYSGRRLVHNDYRENNVQTPGQDEVLDRLKNKLGGYNFNQYTTVRADSKPDRM